MLLFTLFVSCYSTKFCHQCKHFKRHPGLLFFDRRFGFCSMSPKVDENRYYLVTGKIQNVEEYYFCSTARSIESLCGPIGKKFEKKESFL
jgi:hypothetical protein